MTEEQIEELIGSAERALIRAVTADGCNSYHKPKDENAPDVAAVLLAECPPNLREKPEFDAVKDALRIVDNSWAALIVLSRTAAMTDCLSHMHGRPRYLIWLNKNKGTHFSHMNYENGGEFEWAEDVLKNAGKALRSLKEILGEKCMVYVACLRLTAHAATYFAHRYSDCWHGRTFDDFPAAQIEERAGALRFLMMTDEITSGTAFRSEEIRPQFVQILEEMARFCEKCLP